MDKVYFTEDVRVLQLNRTKAELKTVATAKDPAWAKKIAEALEDQRQPHK